MHFYGRDFIVTPDVLIPRLETESLVRKARSLLQPSKLSTYQHTTIIDLGCGSGIIGTSVADLADEVIFLDISEEALKIAEKNFRTHFPDKQAQFIVSDLLSVFLDGTIPLSHYPTIPLYLTNLPYIRDGDWGHMSADTVHEPR